MENRVDIQLGKWARDTVTGFEGVVVGKVDYVTGCRQYLIQPVVNLHGDWRESRWVDEDRLIELARPEPSLSTAASRTGGDKPAPRR